MKKPIRFVEKNLKFSFLLLFMVLMSIAKSNAQNLLLNAGFEDGTGDNFTNWSKPNGASSIFQTTTAGEFRSGGRALKVVVTGTQSNAPEPWSVQMVSDEVPTIIGTSYTFKIWVKALATGTGPIRFSTNPFPDPTADYSGFYDVTTGFTQLSWTFVAQKSTTKMVLDLGKSVNTYFIDDTELTTPTVSSSANLLNPGFELGTGDVFTNWSKPNGASALTQTTTSGEFRSGARALKVVIDGSQSNYPEPYSVQLVSDEVITTIGSSYTFKVWVKALVSGTGSIRFSTNPFPDPTADYSGFYDVTTGFTQLSWTFVAQKSTTKMVLDLGKSINTYFIDDLELTTPAISSGLIQNGGFETGSPENNFTNWEKLNNPGGNTIQETTTVGEFRSGTRGVKAVVATSSNFYDVQLVSDPIYTLVGASYDFKIYVKGNVTGTTVQFSTNPNTSNSLYSGTYDVTTNFTQLGWTFVANTNQTRIVLNLGKFANTYYLDDASLLMNCSVQFSPPVEQTPIATGKNKFLGCIYSAAHILNANKYFNQVTPENAGKWGEVETIEGVYNFASVDAAREYAKVNNFSFRFHVLLWGAQQPVWLKPMTDVQKIAKIRAWMQAVANHYDGSSNARAKLEYIEVLNEALNDPPNNSDNPHPTYGFPGADNRNDPQSGDYVNALKTLNAELGTTPGEYDWIVNAFKLARQYFGCETKLIIDDYAIESIPLAMADYVNIIQLLKNENLVDIVAMQAHTFGTQVYGPGTPAIYASNTANLMTNLNTLAAKGFPVIITELDVDGDVSLDASGERVTTGTQQQKDEFQRSEYERIFNVYWNHPAVTGITLWGYRNGHWRSQTAAYLMDVCSGAERPAMVFLNTTIRASSPPALSTNFNVTGFMKSVQTGNWSDSSTWSCGRIPIITDDVTINPGHVVNIVNDGAKAKKVINNGQLKFSNPASKLGFVE